MIQVTLVTLELRLSQHTAEHAPKDLDLDQQMLHAPVVQLVLV